MRLRGHEARGLRGAIVCRAELDADTVEAMWRVFDGSFAGHPRSVFEADLAEKDRVVLVRDERGLVRGFSTIKVYRERLGEEKIAVLFSGDTIIDPGCWGSPVLQRCWLEVAMQEHARADCPLYWLLICSGYRTYRYLPAFFREFWPRHDAPTPAREQALIDALATRRYGSRYKGGVVELDGGYLREGISPIDKSRRANPHIAFFARANPGHARGAELVCLTRIDPVNFTRAGTKVLEAVA